MTTSELRSLSRGDLVKDASGKAAVVEASYLSGGLWSVLLRFKDNFTVVLTEEDASFINPIRENVQELAIAA